MAPSDESGNERTRATISSRRSSPKITHFHRQAVPTAIGWGRTPEAVGDPGGAGIRVSLYGRRVRIDVALSPDAVVEAPAVAIAVDVIRATTTIAYALAQGYREVVCCPASRTRDAAARDRRGRGARGRGRPPAAARFALGNSPREFAEGTPLGDVLVLLDDERHARGLLAARRPDSRWSARSRTSRRARRRRRAARAPCSGSVAVRCAGADGASCLDDAYVAGRLVAELSAYLPEWQLGDAAELVRSAAGSYTSEVEALGHSSSAVSLREFDLCDDVRVCARVDAVPLVIEAVMLDRGRARAFTTR